MARLKSVCVKWTLVLVLTVFSQYVYSRPQLESTTLDVVQNITTEKTEDLTRYNQRQNNDSFHLFQLPLDNNNTLANKGRVMHDNYNKNISIINSKLNINLNVDRRQSRVIRKIIKQRPSFDTQIQNSEIHDSDSNKETVHSQVNDNYLVSRNVNKPVIKKIVTKWTDNSKYDDLNISNEEVDSDERDDSNFVNIFNSNIQFSSTENNYNSEESTKHSNNMQSDNKRFTHTYNKPRPPYSEETQVYSDNFHVIDNPYVSRPNYIFTTPTPTPIITNVGYPKPWYSVQSNKKPTTTKPVKTYKPKRPDTHHIYNQNFSPNHNNDFDVTTFPPIKGYTDRIVIRPEEYSASSDDCPTIFVTLNNTFQGQAKEACPDLNIAVNTNVVNKNVVIESEEDTDTTLTDVFGLPFDNSASDESINDYEESQENDPQVDSGSNEGLELSSYNAANSVAAGESSETSNIASPSTALSSYTKPSRPNDNDDDMFSFSSVIDFFRPALSAFSWLAAINPLSFSALSFFLTPLILIFAGTSGLAALFTPWALSGREATDVYLNRPQWEWDDHYKTWYLNSFPNSRTLESEIPRSTSWFNKIKELFNAVTKFNKHIVKTNLVDNNRKNKRKKRETWTIRVK